MGVYIKGMEMPTSCAKCKLFGEHGCPFIGAVGYVLTRGERNEDCPLVEVPPHGRLVDADDAFRVLTSYHHHSTDFQHEALKEALARVSTIIPAEESE